MIGVTAYELPTHDSDCHKMHEIFLINCFVFVIMSPSIPTGYIPPATPGKIFLSERIPVTRAIFLSNSLPPGQKWWSNSREWGKTFPNSEKLLLKLAKNPLKNWENYETVQIFYLKNLTKLPPGTLLVTLDVSSLYTNIPHNEGIEACRKALNSSDHLSRSHLKTESICDLMHMILTMNNFEFDKNYYIQLHGTAMGTRMAPAYANLFMADLDRKLFAQSPLKPFIWWRYIDDIFMVWTHGEDKLNEFITHINSSHNTIKFTHEFSESSISFLDVTVLLDNNNQISTDLYVKSTDTHQYLLHTSCHPNHVKKSIPFSLALRIRHICSTAEKFKQRTSELLEFLCKRGHKQQYVQAQINKAFQIPRRDTLYYHSKKNTERPVFVTTYNPSLPQLNSIIRKYFPIFTATKRGSQAFKDAPLIAYRRPKNLRDFLVKAKLKQPSQSNKTQPNIISRCNDGRCRTCKFIASDFILYILQHWRTT